MKQWKSIVMTTALALTVNPASGDSGFIHVSPNLALAQPCGEGASCAFTWTLATRYGEALQYAEERYGRRDHNWTLLGVDLANISVPQIFYASVYQGRKDIVIQLTASAATDEKQALFQLGHEVIHTLSPIGPDRKTGVLEEGLATYNSIEYVRNSGIEINPAYIAAENYEAAYWAIIELENAQPDFQKRTAALRQRYGSLSGLSAQDIRSAYPAISAALAQRLARLF